MGIKEEITKIAVEQGYDGAKPKSIAQAIDALTDTLAGEDVKSGRSVADAIRKYAPYVGSGGGGAKLGGLVNVGHPIAAIVSGSPVYSHGLMFRTAVKPVVGENVPAQILGDWSYYTVKLCSLSIGSQYITGGATSAGATTGDGVSTIGVIFAAAGLTAMGYISADYKITSGIKLYRCKVEPVVTDTGTNVKYTSVSEYPDFTVDENGYITFVIPDLGDNGALVFYYDAE